MPDVDRNEFVKYFMRKYDSLLTRVIKKYLIPNRYTVNDLKQYIAERIVQILKSREDKPNKILDPEKYFKSCLDFYCIEYQRMHGYIFDLPKRPRKNCEADERTARDYGFKYLGDITIEESNSLLDDSVDYNKAQTIQQETPIWNVLTGVLAPEEAEVLGCIYLMNMTWTETSRHLSVAQSTCWFRKNRAIKKLFNRFDTLSGESTRNNIKQFLRGNEQVIGEFQSGLV